MQQGQPLLGAALSNEIRTFVPIGKKGHFVINHGIP